MTYSSMIRAFRDIRREDFICQVGIKGERQIFVCLCAFVLSKGTQPVGNISLRASVYCCKLVSEKKALSRSNSFQAAAQTIHTESL